MKDRPNTFDTFISLVQDMTNNVRPEEPNGDWMPVMLLYNKNGQLGIVGMEFTGHKDKEFWARIIVPMLFRQHKPVYAAQVSTAWMKEIKNSSAPMGQLAVDMANEFGISKDPQRAEIVMLLASDGKTTKSFQASITRHKDRAPTLGTWEPFGAGECSGRFHEMFAVGFAEAGK